MSKVHVREILIVKFQILPPWGAIDRAKYTKRQKLKKNHIYVFQEVLGEN